jgi:hypothetical protein
MLLTQLLWDPLPDSLPAAKPRRFARLRDVAKGLTAEVARPQASAKEIVDRRVPRGFVQALVLDAYQVTLAEQDGVHRRPAAFANAWRNHLTTLLDQPTIELHGWGPRTTADIDANLIWNLYEAASYARSYAIEHAAATKSKRVQRGQQVPTFEFSIVGDGSALGDVIYGICIPCHVGLLYKIGFPTDWQFSGLGRLALGQLEARHPDLTWYTTGQYKHARGFYDRYRRESASPWTANQHPCQHFD